MKTRSKRNSTLSTSSFRRRRRSSLQESKETPRGRVANDKDAPQRFAGEDNSQHLTKTQEEFEMDLPTHHEVTDVTDAGILWKMLQEYGNTGDAFIATQEEYQKKSRVLETRSGSEVANLEHPKNKRPSKFEKESVEFQRRSCRHVECNPGRHGHHFNHAR